MVEFATDNSWLASAVLPDVDGPGRVGAGDVASFNATWPTAHALSDETAIRAVATPGESADVDTLAAHVLDPLIR